MNRNKAGIVCMIGGAVLILSALLFLFYNRQEDSRAGRAAETILPDMQAAISEHVQSSPPEYYDPLGQRSDEMTVMEIDGYGYIGYLSLPLLELELPVMADWSYPQLKIAPCRQFGSTKSDNLVIAGHNYRRHFGKLSHLTAGSPVLFTDMDGEVSYYLAGSVSVIPPQSTEEVQNSEWDLVLYTCTYGGQNRVMVGCKRTTRQIMEAVLAGS